jgi:hypothetical protein
MSGECLSPGLQTVMLADLEFARPGSALMKHRATSSSHFSFRLGLWNRQDARASIVCGGSAACSGMAMVSATEFLCRVGSRFCSGSARTAATASPVMSVIRERSAHPSAGAFADVGTGVIVAMASVGRKRPSYHGGRGNGLAKAMVSRRSCQESKIAYVVIATRLLKNRRRVASFSRAERQRWSAISQAV